MFSLFRLWQVFGYFYFCLYETFSRYLTPIAAKLLGYLLFFPYRFLLAYPPHERLRVAFERLGGAYVKIGQLLSTRIDILPPNYVRELEKLQDRVPPQPLEELLEHYGGLREKFSYIDPEPIGSGSVAQVHKALLKDGTSVALKVIRPQAERLIKRDVSALKLLVKLASLFPAVREFKIPQILSEFERMLLSELDLSTEAAYMELFRKFSEKEPKLYVPKVFWEATSSRYLTTEFLEGEKLSSGLFRQFPEKDRKEIAASFVRIVNRMVFELGVFHGDLHPGNVFFLPNGKFGFVDFGIVGRLSPDALSEFFLFSLGAMNRDPDLIVSALKRIGAVSEAVDENLLKREILIFLDKYYNRPLSQIDAERIFYEELSVARRFKIVLPEELVTLMKTIAHTESIARLIYPDFRLPPVLKPYLKKVAPKFLVSTLKRKTFRLFDVYLKFIEEFPENYREKRKGYLERSVFWSSALLAFAVVLAFSPKLLVFFFPALLLAKKIAIREI